MKKILQIMNRLDPITEIIPGHLKGQSANQRAVNGRD